MLLTTPFGRAAAVLVALLLSALAATLVARWRSARHDEPGGVGEPPSLWLVAGLMLMAVYYLYSALAGHWGHPAIPAITALCLGFGSVLTSTRR